MKNIELPNEILCKIVENRHTRFLAKQNFVFHFNLERTRDVKEVNRKCAFLTLADKVSVRAFTIAQRVKLLSGGLKDRSTVVKQACGQMMKAWLRSYDQNIIKLLEAIDTEASIDCSELMLEFLFKGTPKNYKLLFYVLYVMF